VKELYQAIKTRFDSSAGASIRGLSTSLLVGYHDQNTTQSELITLTNPAGSTDWTLSDSAGKQRGYDTVNIDVNIWTNKRSPQSALTVANAWRRVYDNQLLTMSSSYTMDQAMRTSPAIQIEEPESKGWHVVLSYQYRVGRGL
jgi:hypothetical protein